MNTMVTCQVESSTYGSPAESADKPSLSLEDTLWFKS